MNDTLALTVAQNNTISLSVGENTEAAAASAAAAAAQVTLAAAQVTLAAGQVTLAAGQVTLAAGQVALATVEKNAASSFANAAAASVATIATLEAAQYRYATKAAATAALAGIPADGFIYVFSDESRNGRVTVYRKTAGVLVFQNTLTGEPLTFFVDPILGSNANPGTRAAPFATVLYAMQTATAGDTVELAPGAVIKENFPYNFGFPNNVRLRGSPEGAAWFLNFDKIVGAWIADGTAWYRDINHAFGGVAPIKSDTVIIPTMLFRQNADNQLSWLSKHGDVSPAAGIAYVKANPGTFFSADMSGGNSGENGFGWSQGVHRVYVRMPGDINPNTLNAILYAQRFLPPFAKGGHMENVRVVGTFAKDAVACSNGGTYLSNVQVYYPAHHGFVTAGAQTVDCLVAHSSPTASGYACHHFGGEENFQTQKYAHHRRMKVIDWIGAAVACHGHGGGTDGGGGPDVVMDCIQFDDFYGEDIIGMGDAYQVRTGITFNDAQMKDCRRIGAYNTSNCTMNNLRLLHTRQHYQPTFCAPGTVNAKLVINGGSSFSRGSYLFDSTGGPGGTIQLNEHIALVASGEVCGGAGTYNVKINGGVIQLNRGLPLSTLEAGAAINFTVTGSVFSGVNLPYIKANQVNTVLTYDMSTVFGGDAGLKRGSTVEQPVSVDPESGYFTARERIIASTGNVSGGSAYVTNKRYYALLNEYPTGETATAEFAAGFEPTMVVGTPGTFSYIGGKAGKLYSVFPGTPDAVPTAVAGIGVTEDVTGYARISGSNILIFTWDGTTSRAYTLAPYAGTLAAATAPGAAYPILGGVSDGGANLLIWGAFDNNSSGGARKSTDDGVTYAAVDASMTGKPKTGAYINGTFVLAGDFGAYNFFTAATVGGVWTQRPIAMADAKSMTVDAVAKRLIFCGSFTGATEASKFGQKDVLYSLDCSDANPTNWPFAASMDPPFGDIHSVICVPAGIGYVAPSKAQITVFGRSPKFAATFDTVRGGNWTKRLRLGDLSRIAGRDTRKIDDFAIAYM